MSRSLVRHLILKDFQMHRTSIVFAIIAGVAGLAFLQLKGLPGLLGIIGFFTTLIVLGSMIPNTSILNERKGRNLAFLMSLPIIHGGIYDRQGPGSTRDVHDSLVGSGGYSPFSHHRKKQHSTRNHSRNADSCHRAPRRLLPDDRSRADRRIGGLGYGGNDCSECQLQLLLGIDYRQRGAAQWIGQPDAYMEPHGADCSGIGVLGNRRDSCDHVLFAIEKERLRVEVRQTPNSNYETTRRLFPPVHR